MKDTERKRQRQRQKQAPCREPNVGLDPRSPESDPGLQVALNCCATGAVPLGIFLYKFIFYWHSICQHIE